MEGRKVFSGVVLCTRECNPKIDLIQHLNKSPSVTSQSNLNVNKKGCVNFIVILPIRRKNFFITKTKKLIKASLKVALFQKSRSQQQV